MAVRALACLCDSRLGRDALYRAAGTGLWIGRPVEWPGSRPLMLEPEIGPDFGGLSEWPVEHVVKALCFCHPDDDAALWAEQEATVLRLFHAARRNRLEFLLEVIPSKVGAVSETTTAEVIARFYGIGVFPDWWKLEPMQTGRGLDRRLRRHHPARPHTRGIVVLGLGEDEAALGAAFEAAARHRLVKGFAVGRTIFGEVAEGYMDGTIGPEAAVSGMMDRYARLCALWDTARARAEGASA
jgi:5-dehydro-2-deoxygluconokinase